MEFQIMGKEIHNDFYVLFEISYQDVFVLTYFFEKPEMHNILISITELTDFSGVFETKFLEFNQVIRITGENVT
ncbi:hypothetical protein YC2023_001789 [Brassica napus]